MPAIPHITLSFQIHRGSNVVADARSDASFGVAVGVTVHCGREPQPIFAVLIRVTCAAVAGGPENVDHLASGDKVQGLLSVLGARDQIRQEALHRVSEHSLPVVGIHTVAMQFYEQPIRAALDGDRRLLPEPQPAHTGRIHSGERGGFEPSYTAARRAIEIEHERPLNDDGEGLQWLPLLEIAAVTVRSPAVERERTFV